MSQTEFIRKTAAPRTLNFSRAGVDHLIKAGHVQSIKLGSVVFVKPSQFYRFAVEHSPDVATYAPVKEWMKWVKRIYAMCQPQAAGEVC